jgi:starch synthase
METRVGGAPVIVTRTGYSGDLGYEIWSDAGDALPVWDALVEAGRPHGLLPAGLDAYDMCRVEAGFILNGVDYQVWNPGRDRLIPYPYTARTLRLKRENKTALQEAFGIPVKTDLPLFGHVGRLVEQKGLDLIMDLIPELVQRRLQMVFLGTGQPQLEQALRQAHQRHADKIGVHIAYDEPLAHLIEAGSDAFLMPSRFEPCGLNQLYSLRYGTPPIVRRTGGLADSVLDANGPNLYARTATGFVFDKAEPRELLRAIDRALNLYARQRVWTDLIETAMRQDFSWTRSANAYLQLYQQVLEARRAAHEERRPTPPQDFSKVFI